MGDSLKREFGLNKKAGKAQFGRKAKKPGDWLKKRIKGRTTDENLRPAELVKVMLEDFSADFDPMRAGGPSDPWRQGGFGPIPGMDSGAEGDSVCPACQGKATDEVGEPCPNCEGTGQCTDLEVGDDQLNDPGTDPMAGMAPGGPTAGPSGVALPKYGSRMSWRPQESLARRLFRP